MGSSVQQSWEDFLNPDVIRPRLISASIYIAGFESLKESIIGRLRDFYYIGLDPAAVHPGYEERVRSRNSSALYASLDWLKEMNAIDDSDIAVFDRVKACRNNLAHKLFRMMGSEGLPSDFERCFGDMVALLRKIEVWWIVNVEIPTDPDFLGQEIDHAEITPGPVLIFQLLCDTALGDEDKSRHLYYEFRRGVSSVQQTDSMKGNA